MPVVLVLAGPPEFEVTAEWLLPAIEANGGTSKLLDFRSNGRARFESSMALLMLQLQPNHVSAFARELSSIATEMPKLRASDAVQALTEARKELKACRSTLRDIVGLALDNASGHILVEAEIMAELKEVFEAYCSTSPEVALSICWVIGNMLAVTGDELARDLYDDGAAGVVLRIMQMHEKDKAVQLHGCLALQRLVYSDMFVEAGGAECLQTLFRLHSNDSTILLQGIRLLQAIVISTNVTEALRTKISAKFKNNLKKAMASFPEGSLLNGAAVQCRDLIANI